MREGGGHMRSRSVPRISYLLLVFSVVSLLLWSSACATGTTTSSPLSSGPADRSDQGATTLSSIASADSSTTFTTLAPGVMSFETLLDRFQTVLEREGPNELLPYEIVPSTDVAWLLESGSRANAVEVQGYSFVNGDLAILFFVEPTTSQEATQAALDEVAQQKYSQEGRTVNTYVNGDFGFIVASHDYWRELRRLTQWAREAYPELIYGK